MAEDFTDRGEFTRLGSSGGAFGYFDIVDDFIALNAALGRI